jgi:hypothetical protein
MVHLEIVASHNGEQHPIKSLGELMESLATPATEKALIQQCAQDTLPTVTLRSFHRYLSIYRDLDDGLRAPESATEAELAFISGLVRGSIQDAVKAIAQWETNAVQLQGDGLGHVGWSCLALVGKWILWDQMAKLRG